MFESYTMRGSNHNKIPPERKAQIVEIYANNHKGETIRKFREILMEDYGYTHSTNWLAGCLEAAGLYKKEYYAL